MRNNQNSQELTIEQAISRAKKATKKGKIADAVELYTAVLAQQPNHPVAKEKLNKLQKELPHDRSAQAQTTQPSQVQIAPLFYLYQTGQMAEVELACGKLLKSYPQSLAVLNILGVALRGQGKLQEAVNIFNKAIQLKPSYAMAHSNLGLALHDLGQLDAAVKSYERALMIDPDYPEAQNNLGLTLHKLGQLDAAVKSYEKALAIDSLGEKFIY